MSAISLKSITGITSITTPAGVDNVFTVHTNDTTERFRIDQTGNQNIVGIVTVTKDLDVDGHTNLDNVNIVGVTTTSGLLDINAGGNANTFRVGDLTSGRVVLAGTNGELEDSSKLTFDGTTLQVENSLSGLRNLLRLKNSNASAGVSGLFFNSTTSGTAFDAACVRNGVNGSGQGRLFLQTNNGSGLVTNLEVEYDGQVSIPTNSLNINDSIVHIGDTNTKIRFPANDTISFETAGGERLRIKNDSSLLHTRSDNVQRYDLEFRNTGGISNGNYGGIKFTQGSSGATNLAAIEIAYADTGRPDIVFKHRNRGGGNASQEAMRIDSNGDITFANNNTNATANLSSLIFANSTGEVSSIKGATRNGNTNGMIIFNTDISGTSAESMRINHDGGFCVGTTQTRTAEFTHPDGFSVRSRDASKGQFQNTVTDVMGGLMNRDGSDGAILGFRREGNVVGHIGVNANTMYLNFGSTSAAAHQLDDYETGTFTCTVYYATGNTTGNHTNTTNINGYFEKIGNLVFISISLYPSNYNSGNTAVITKFSLPHTPVTRAAAAFYRYSGAGNYGGMLPQSSQDDAGSYLDTNGFGYVIVGGTNQGSGFWGHHGGGYPNASGHVSGSYRIA